MNGTSAHAYVTRRATTGGTTMGATAFLPVRNYQRPIRAHATNPPSRHAKTRPRHDPGSKQARKGHEKCMVWTWFFPPQNSQPPPPPALTPPEKHFFRYVTDLPNEPT